MPTQRTFILGAGASASYEFPLGSGLIKDIRILINNPPKLRQILSNHSINIDENVLKEFQTLIKNPFNQTIDAFIKRSHNEQFTNICNILVKEIISGYEKIHKMNFEDNSYQEKENDDWVNRLFNLITDDDLHQFYNSNLNIITFNYDRSFEYLLLKASETCPKGKNFMMDFLDSNVIHIHGSLGKLEDVGDYGAISTESDIYPIGSPNKNNVMRAHDFLENSKSVLFLGFSYNSDNMQLLFPTNKKYAPDQQVAGTYLGLDERDRKEIWRHYQFLNFPPKISENRNSQALKNLLSQNSFRG